MAPSPTSQIHILKFSPPHGMLLGSGAFGRWWEVTWVELAWMDFLPLQMTPREPLAPPNTARRRLSMNQKAGPARHGISQHLHLGLPGLLTVRMRCLLFYNPPASVAFYYSRPDRLRQSSTPYYKPKWAVLGRMLALTRVSAVLAVSLQSILTLFKISSSVVVSCLMLYPVRATYFIHSCTFIFFSMKSLDFGRF